jgi:hypothetical protein
LLFFSDFWRSSPQKATNVFFQLFRQFEVDDFNNSDFVSSPLTDHFVAALKKTRQSEITDDRPLKILKESFSNLKISEIKDQTRGGPSNGQTLHCVKTSSRLD